MKHSNILLFFAFAFVLSSCGKEPEQATRFSVLGDSFSAYKGYVDPESNETFPYDQLDFTGPEQMWWAQVADSLAWVMDKNNSYSGSLISKFNTGDYYTWYSFIHRMDNLGNPDVIFLFGATNDIYRRVPLGDFVYDGWTEEQLCTFRPAMAYLIDNLKRLYPRAEIYVMVDMELCINDSTIDDVIRQAYIDSMHRIANRYHVNSIDLYEIKKNKWHPNIEGQQHIARQVIEALMADFNV